MRTYEELKAELLKISEIVEKFPVEVKPKVYDLLVSRFLGGDGFIPQNQTPAERAVPTRKERKDSSKGGAKESYSIDKNLNLRGDKNTPSFRDFYEEKKPGSAKEFNTVAVYYLRQRMGLSDVSMNHVYTCYAEVKKKPPGHFKQSFIDTKNKLGYLDLDDNGNLDIPHRGVVFVEHDLPKKEDEKKD